jgi:hypothetical protein
LVKQQQNDATYSGKKYGMKNGREQGGNVKEKTGIKKLIYI